MHSNVLQVIGLILVTILWTEAQTNWIRNNVAHMIQKDDDWGHAENCNKEFPSEPMTMMWRPKVIDRSKVDKIDIALSITAPTGCSSILCSIYLYIKGLKNPIVSIQYGYDCESIKLFDPFLRCPVKTNDRLAYNTTLQYLDTITAGDYHVVAECLTENKKMFVCLELNATVLS